MARFLLLAALGIACGPMGHAAPGEPTQANAKAEEPAPTTPEGEMLQLINEYRAAAGVEPVVLDPSLSKGCREHAEYMKLNRGTPAMHGLRAHRQDPTLPGATPAGAACAKAADLYPSVSDLRSAVHGFMSSLYHRRPIVSPDIERIGIGHTEIFAGRHAVALMFVYGTSRPESWPVALPGNGQTNVLVDFISETPNPLPRGVAYAGFPFTLQFPAHDRVTNVTATLKDGTGNPVPFYLSSPEAPATTFPQQGIVALIPTQPLRAATRYTATIKATWRGKTKTWTSSWTTLAREKLDATDAQGLVDAIGKPALVRGTITRASKVTEGTISLLILSQPGAPMVSNVRVHVPIDVLRSLSKQPLHELRGRTIEVAATPRMMLKSVKLTITTADQLRFVD